MVTISVERLCLHFSEGVQNPEVEIQMYNYILSLLGLLKERVMFWRRTNKVSLGSD